MTPKQTLFVAEYLANGLNATQAAISAGYSEKSAASIGEENLRKPEIAAAIAESSQKHLEALDYSIERTLREVSRLAFFDVASLFEDDGSLKRIKDIDVASRAAIAGLEVTELFEGDGEQKHAYGLLKKVKLADKGAALDKLMRYHSLYKDKVDLPEEIIVRVIKCNL
jgi:phage terminase small subunit